MKQKEYNLWRVKICFNKSLKHIKSSAVIQNSRKNFHFISNAEKILCQMHTRALCQTQCLSKEAKNEVSLQKARIQMNSISCNH